VVEVEKKGHKYFELNEGNGKRFLKIMRGATKLF
jgi:hypothetical protein